MSQPQKPSTTPQENAKDSTLAKPEAKPAEQALPDAALEQVTGGIHITKVVDKSSPTLFIG